MKTLILNIDRDNDFGVKCGITAPVIGYSQCYSAAVRLITVDPEDSDANALFGALKHYEKLQSEGEDIEIALVTGDEDVGEKSDQIISKQLDLIFNEEKYDSVILISDGAEDDYVIPLVLSKAKIRYVKHIIVRHNQNIESLYYYIVKAVQDKKMIKKVAVPVGLLLLTYGAVSLIFNIIFDFMSGRFVSNNPSDYAAIFVTVVIGAYFIDKGFDMRMHFGSLISRLRTYSEEARIMFIGLIVAIGLVMVGIADTYSLLIVRSLPALDNFLKFIQNFSLWIYAALLTLGIFRIVDSFIGNGKRDFKNYYSIIFLLSAELVFFGMTGYIRYVLKYETNPYGILSMILLFTGIGIAVLTAVMRKKLQPGLGAETSGN